jgi:hypothetical protein
MTSDQCPICRLGIVTKLTDERRVGAVPYPERCDQCGAMLLIYPHGTIVPWKPEKTRSDRPSESPDPSQAAARPREAQQR